MIFSRDEEQNGSGEHLNASSTNQTEIEKHAEQHGHWNGSQQTRAQQSQA